ncbi:hypothetical protein [Swaminathania salitolerans]|uniref:Uncharacterized protein n=1 Tax=Swaminathania salitolerans TaxID=182838 RepID=A0A511BQG2_9PROT|nr:hypothetical protein [Swaminathania salitolerans]GBQ14746.1 hypothetical protein AA21291_1943 [Swaminathania salitolerans LMG 21291]GEL01874.1 hypothetical protein SSA02_10370 [Swaminathania salitolerans]
MTLTILESPAEGLALVSLDALREQLAGEPGGQNSDPALSEYLAQASALVQATLGRPVLAGLYRQTLRVGDGERRLSLALTASPLLGIVTVSQDGFTLDPGPEGWETGTWSGLLYPSRLQGAWWWPGCYRVTYRGGWIVPGMKDDRGAPLAPTVPADIRAATLSTARALFFAARRGDPLLRSESEQGVGASSWATPDAGLGGLPPDAASILARYAQAGLS